MNPEVLDARQEQQRLEKQKVLDLIERLKSEGRTLTGEGDKDAFLQVPHVDGYRSLQIPVDNEGAMGDVREVLWQTFEAASPGTAYLTKKGVSEGLMMYWKGSDGQLHDFHVRQNDDKHDPAAFYRDVKLYAPLRVIPATEDALRGYQITDADPTVETNRFGAFVDTFVRYVASAKAEKQREQTAANDFAATGL